jgi:hypothetical protein
VVGLLVAGAAEVHGPYATMTFFHLALIAAWLLGAAFDDAVAEVLRAIAAGMVTLFALPVVVGFSPYHGVGPWWLADVNLIVLVAALGGYGWALGNRVSIGVAIGVAVAWTTGLGWRLYVATRRHSVGMDYLAASMLLFFMAVAVSVAKSSRFRDWLRDRRRSPSDDGIDDDVVVSDG